MPEETTQVNTQVASAENSQTTETATGKENLQVPPESSVPSAQTPSESVQSEQTSTPSTPSEPQAKQTSEQVGEQVETVTLDSVDKITDEDFNNPTRSIILPSLPQKLLNLIGKKLKPVLLKKNILEKNKNNHPELSAEDNRKILDAALYHSELIGQSQPNKRPNYWVAVKLDSGKNAVVVFDMEETKTHHEIVGWHFANEKGLANLQKQAVREGGQILDMRNNSQSPSDQTGTDTTNTIPRSAEKSSGGSEKIINKITSSPAGSNTRIMAFTELADGEHTVNGKTFTKKGNAFTLDGKELNAREIEKATRTLTEKIKAKPKAETETASDKKSDQSERIEDYGEKIGGARKDIIRQYADKINLNGATFAKMFPKPDYAKLLEAGIKIDVLAKLKAAYDMAKKGVKQHKTLDGRQDLRVAKFYAVYAKNALIGEESVDMAESGYVFTDYGKRSIIIRSQAMEQLLKELGVEYANVDLSNFDISDTWENGVKPEKPKWYGVQSEEWEKRYRVWTVHGSRTGFFDKVEDAIKYYIEVVKKHTTLDQPKYKILTYKALSGEHAGEYYLAAKIRGFGDVTLQYFKSLKEAWKYSDEHAEDLQHQAAEMEEQKKAERSSKFKGKDKSLRLRFNTETLRDRVGIDYRNGKDISAKEFSEKFNFRAVEFGNSVSQKERQLALNALYDSLLDLAALLDISPKAISLNGKLAFAYGARGVGNAEAHYEPEKNVINLTKTRGAGNVAHEWWHALDYYFADSKNNPAMDGKYRDGIRPEIKKIFEELQKLFSGNSEYVIRAERLDAFTKKEYYTQPTEMAARAFADYVSRQLEAQGQVNDFLSNHVSETDWKGEENTYPYPTGDDAVKIGDTFQSLFNTIDEKVDESGNAVVFSMIGDRGAARMENAEILLDNLRIAREMTAEGKDAKTIKLATGWEKGGDGKWRMEIPDLKWKTEATLPDGTKYERTPFDMTWTSGKLGDYVNAPELFQAYPELKNIKLDTKILPWEQYGYFDENRNEIVINHEKLAPIAESIDYIEDEKGKDARRQELIDTIETVLIHEVQHAIQEIEGFAKGGSRETDVRESQDPVLQRHIDKANELITEKEKLEKQLKELKKSPEANEKQISSVKHRIARIEELLDTNRINAESATSPQSTYKRLAGEVESRNAVTRSKMSMDERRQSLLDETADVAEEDRIYLMESVGVSELAEPFTENQKRELLNKAKAAGLKKTPILQKILYGGTITRNGNTVRFTGENSHQIKKHLVAKGLSPIEGFISFEDIETMLPQALATEWKPNTKRNKRGRKATNKVYTIVKDGVRYKLVTKFNGDFLSFYSNRESVGDVYWDKPGSASSQRSDNKIHSSDSKVKPTSEKNPEKSLGDSAFSVPTDLGDTSLSPIDYRRSIDPLFDFVMEYTDNGMVNPGREHEGEDFSGSFISSEFVAYSEKKPQGKKQSDAQYQQYLAKRERALNTAEGTPLDDWHKIKKTPTTGTCQRSKPPENHYKPRRGAIPAFFMPENGGIQWGIQIGVKKHPEIL